jgi:hypothetical protein
MRNILLSAALLTMQLPLHAQLDASGEMAAHFAKTARTTSPRVFNAGNPWFGYVGLLYTDISVSERVGAAAALRVVEDDWPYIAYMFIQVDDLTPLHLSFDAGKINLPFGNLNERRFPRRNPFFGLPLMNNYRTALPSQLTTEAELLSERGKGHGMRVLEQGLYDIGCMVEGSWGMLDYAYAITNGTVSAAPLYGPGNVNSDFGQIVRAAITPITGVSIGAAYAWGSYLEEPDTPTRAVNVEKYIQKSAEIDVDFSRGHVVFSGQAVYTVWPVPLETRDVTLRVFGYSVEGKYTLMPRFFVALRVGGLHFGTVSLGGADRRWDDPVTEFEGSIGQFIDRNLLLKLVRRETRIYGGNTPSDNLTALQLVLAF